jgi:hypothetical protein
MKVHGMTIREWPFNFGWMGEADILKKKNLSPYFIEKKCIDSLDVGYKEKNLTLQFSTTVQISVNCFF